MPFVTNEGDIVKGPQFANNPNYRTVSQEHADKIVLNNQIRDQEIIKLQNRHKGEEIHVLGSGPSLAGYVDTSRPTIAVNGAPAVYRNPTYFLMCDDFTTDSRPLYQWIRDWLATKPIVTVLLRRGILTDPDAFQHDFTFRRADGPGSEIKGGLAYGRSSVTAAIDLARHMGASKIVLFGVDYNDRSHAYSSVIRYDKDDLPGVPWAKMPLIEAEFKSMYEYCKARKVELVNGNPNSALNVIPKLAASPVIPQATLPSHQPDDVVVSTASGTIECWINNEIVVSTFEEASTTKLGKALLTAAKAYLASQK